MSIRILIAGYSLSLFVAIIGCIAIARSRHAGRGLWWLIGGLLSAFAGLLFFAGQSLISPFFTIILANEAILVSYALLHQGIVSILGSPRRYIGLSILLVVGLFSSFLYYTYAVPDIRARILLRTAAITIQVTASVLVLFRHKDPDLQYPIRVAGGVLAAFSLLQVSRLFATVIWLPLPDRLHPDSIQVFYDVFTYMLGLGSGFAVVWLTWCAQRLDLQIMATTDGLSGLMNRRTFDEVLERELRRSERGQVPVALLLIDLDHFKTINDEHGHQMGDEVIRRVSQLLLINTRPRDAVARYGGEEFAMHRLRPWRDYRNQSG